MFRGFKNVFRSGEVLVFNIVVAPVTVNKNSIVGAGSVITKNVQAKSLALTRSPQFEVKNYKRKKK